MGRLMIRMLGFPVAAQLLWRCGMLVRMARERILVELEPQSCHLRILVRTELRGEQMSNLCWLVFAAVDSLVKEWYSLSVRISSLSPLARWHDTHDDTQHTTRHTRQARVLVPCPHCMVFGGLDREPYVFAFEECQQAAITPNDAFLYCILNGTPAPYSNEYASNVS
jgi:hypothetical protein